MAAQDASRQPSRLRLRGFRWYSSPPGAPTRRRPSDVLLLVLCAAGVILLAPPAPGPTDLDQALVTVLDALPDALTWLFEAGYALTALWAVLLLVVALLTPHRRLLGLQLLLAAVLGTGVASIAGLQAGTDADRFWGSLLTAEPPPVYTAVRVAAVTAVVVTASPHLSRPLRAVGRLLLLVVAVSSVALGLAFPIGASAGFLAGVTGAALVHVFLGSPGGHLSPAQVVSALADLGLPGAEVSAARSARGAPSAYPATIPGRPPLLVTVLGRDEWNAQAATSVWTAATRRGERLSLGTTRLARVDHTALATMLAERAGVRVLPVVSVGRSAEGDAVLVTVEPARALADLPAEQVTDDLLAGAWTQLLALHAAGIAHGRVDARTVTLDQDGRVALTDFSQAEVAADPRDLMVDRVRLLATTALVTDTSRAVGAARQALGDDLVAILPFLQPAVLDRATRRRISAGEWDVATLRDAVVAATGVQPPPLEQVSRVSVRSLLRVALILLVTYGLISALSGVDLASVWQEISSADWAWLLAALLVSPLAQVFFAFSTLGATTAALRYLPVLMLQYAVQFIALVLPATAARIALDVRFFQSFGVAAGAAVSLGVIDSFSGFVVQVLLLAVILLSGLPGLTTPIRSGDTSSSGTDSGSSEPSMLALAVGIALVSLVVVVVVPRLRHRVAGRIRGTLAALRAQLHEARGALDVLRHPVKVAQMLGGNLGGQVVQAVVLGMCLAAFGESASLSQLVLINTGVSLFAGLMPVPGGVGVAEAGLTAGLQAIGIPSSVAISTAIAFRLVTFYLPPLWGSLAMRWLHRRSYV